MPFVDETNLQRLADDIKGNIVDDLATSSATKFLSAKQGKALNDNKVDKVTGKGLSTNDYTTAEKTKLAELETNKTFIATYGTTTFAELQAATTAGKHIVVMYGGDVYQLAYYSTANYYFAELYSTTNYYCNCASSGAWTSGTASMQNISQKANTLDNPNNNNYPTTKAVADAIAGIGSRTYFATVYADDWTLNAPYTQTITVQGLTAQDNPVLDIDMSGATSATYEDLEDAWACVSYGTTGANTLTLTCFAAIPQEDMDIIIKV